MLFIYCVVSFEGASLIYCYTNRKAPPLFSVKGRTTQFLLLRVCIKFGPDRANFFFGRGFDLENFSAVYFTFELFPRLSKIDGAVSLQSLLDIIFLLVEVLPAPYNLPVV